MRTEGSPAATEAGSRSPSQQSPPQRASPRKQQPVAGRDRAATAARSSSATTAEGRPLAAGFGMSTQVGPAVTVRARRAIDDEPTDLVRLYGLDVSRLVSGETLGPWDGGTQPADSGS